MANCCRPAARLLRGWAWTVCLLATASAARAQVTFDSWTIDDGLPQNSVNDIRQTRDGYLWLATFGGLVRFDGIRFVVFDRSVDGIGSLRIRTLREDRGGTLWAATEDGMLIRHRDGIFRTFTGDDGLPQEVALRIDEDDSGRLWVTWQETVTRIDGTRFVNFAAGDFPRDVRNRAEPPSLGPAVVWWSQDEQGLHCLVAGRVVSCLPPDQLPQGGVRAVTRDFAGTLWVQGTRGEVVQITAGGRQRRLSTRDGLPAGDGEASFFHEDREGSIWNARRTGDVYRIAHGRRELAARFLLSIHEDREGSTWIGTTGGLHRLRRPTISQRTVREGLSSDNVYSILRDRRGDVWAGTWGSGLNRSVAGRFIAYRAAHGLPSDYVTAVYEDPSGRLWAGTSRGLAYFKGDRFHAYDAAAAPLSGSIWAMHQDRAGRFWFATDRGLVCRQGQRFTTYTAAHGLANSRVMALHEDRAGALWIGTARGLSRLHDGAFVSYTEREGFVGNYVRAFHEDAEGVLWIGTYDGGLYRLENGRLTRYTTRTGLHDNGVFQILDDGQDHFWMSSNRGLSRVSRRELNEYAAGRLRSIRATAFGPRDGLATLECNGGRQPAGQRMPDGTLWFPTQGGIAIVQPKALRTNHLAPPVLIEAVRVRGEPVSIRGGLVVGPRHDSIEIRYTGLSFVKSEQVRFKYRLVGLHDDWVDAGDRRTVAFYGIPAGRYVFEVTAANSDGVWSREGARLPLLVEAPVWRRAWFLAVLAVAGGLLLVIVERMRSARVRRERERQRTYARQLIEAQEGERRRISNDLHDSLGQSLLLIRSHARAAREQGHASPALETVSDLAGEAYADLKEIAYDIRPYQLDKIGVSRTIHGLVRRLDGSCGVALEAEIADIDAVVPAGGAIDVYRIVQEGISNVLRHSGARRARVAIRREDGHVEIEIADDGRGFPAPARASRTAAWRFGLMGIEERARSLDGRLVVRTAPGGGTTLLVRFAAGRPGGG